MIHELASLGFGPTLIRRELMKEGAKEVPSTRTIQTYLSRLRTKGPPTAWEWTDASPNEAALVLPVIAAVMANSAGQVRSVTRQAADWIFRLRLAIPSLRPSTAYWLAVRYAAAVEYGRSTSELDDYVAAYAGGPDSGAYKHSALMRAAGPDR